MHLNPDFNNSCCLSCNTVLNTAQTSKAITSTPTAAAQELRMSELHELLSSGWPGVGSEVFELSLQGRHWHCGIVSQDCKPCLWAAVEGWQGFVPLVLHTHNLWPFKAVLSELSDSSRGHWRGRKEIGSSIQLFPSERVPGREPGADALAAWQSMELCGPKCFSLCV